MFHFVTRLLIFKQENNICMHIRNNYPHNILQVLKRSQVFGVLCVYCAFFSVKKYLLQLLS